MTLFLDDGDVRLYHGDALETLRLLPDGCVDMVATSPPFYGLRDYGTGEWEGGDADCDHQKIAPPIPAERYSPGGAYVFDREGQKYGSECGKCGARRVDRQIGLEETPQAWVDNLVAVFRECRRVLADHGTLWVEIGDSYSGHVGGTVGQSSGLHGADSDTYRETLAGGHGQSDKRTRPGKPKDLLGQPWMLAFALRADGWYLRSEIIWARPNPMPESVTDRPTKAHSTVFLLSKQSRYFYDADAIRQPYNGPDDPSAFHFRYGNARTITNGVERVGDDATGRRNDDYTANPAGANARSVWTIPTEPTPFAHFATWPQKLVARMIQAGTSEHGKCPVCGKPWVRETRSEGVSDRHPKDGRGPGLVGGLGDVPTRGRAGAVGRFGYGVEVTTLGWSPSCACALVSTANEHVTANSPPPVPCTVLDPFAGSGTTLLVARNHQRHAIGIELNPDYCKLAAERLQQLSLLTSVVE